MDQPIRGIAAQRGVSGVGSQKREPRQNETPFELDAEQGEPDESEPESARVDEDLPTAPASDDEAGGRLDVTA